MDTTGNSSDYQMDEKVEEIQILLEPKDNGSCKSLSNTGSPQAVGHELDKTHNKLDVCDQNVEMNVEHMVLDSLDISANKNPQQLNVLGNANGHSTYLNEGEHEMQVETNNVIDSGKSVSNNNSQQIIPHKEDGSEVYCDVKVNLEKIETSPKLPSSDTPQTNSSNESNKDKLTKADRRKLKNEKLKVGENYDRINYLVQASQKIFKTDKSVSSQLGSLAISFGRRLPQVRLDPLLKREMCKGCGVYLVYGVNAKVRHRSKRQKHLVVTCMTCKTIKRFVTNPNHKLWNEQPEAQVE